MKRKRIVVTLAVLVLSCFVIQNALASPPTLKWKPAITKLNPLQETLEELVRTFDFVDFDGIWIPTFPKMVRVGRSVLEIYWLENKKDDSYRGAVILGKDIAYQIGRAPGQVKILHWITNYEKRDQGVPEALYVVKAEGSQWIEIESFHFYLVAHKESEYGFSLSLMVNGRHVDYNETFWSSE